jgi:pimeloyl-[acyl-carrier protein] methyl ester esterase
MVALETAIYFPERVDRLVLISSCPVFSTPDTFDHELPASRLRAMILGLHRDRRETLRRFFSLVHSESRSESRAAEDLRLAMQLEPPHLIHGLRYLQSVDLCARLSSVQVPTLIIHGRKDRVISWQASLLLQEGIARSKLLLVDDGDHGLAASRPNVLAPAIVQFSNADPVFL